MKFSCEKEILLGLLGTASRAVTGKSSMPLLEGLLICADASTLTVTGYDMSMGIRTTTETDVVEPGSIVINAKLLLDIVRKLPNDVVYIETDDKLMTTVKCGRAVFNLAATEADEFPALAEVSSATGFSLPQNILKSMISQTIFSVSDNESKPIHTGCLFELDGSRLNVAAVDGYRLSVRRETIEGMSGEMKFVVPGASLREIERILGELAGVDTRLLPRDSVGNRRLMYRTYIEEAQRFRWPGDPEYTGPDAEYCYGLRKQIAVLCDGTVVPCCLDGQGKLKLGNIFFQRMDEILGSHRAVCIRQGFDRRQPYEELCRRCGYAARFN